MERKSVKSKTILLSSKLESKIVKKVAAPKAEVKNLLPKKEKKRSPFSTRKSEIKREWHLVDAKDKVVGRLATTIAPLLLGKNKPYYVPHLDCGDFVVVINAKEVVFTGKKEAKKMYYRHSGYPGGLKTIPVSRMRAEKPEEIIKRAVKGMVPHNRLGDAILKKLFVYPGSEYPDKQSLHFTDAKSKQSLHFKEDKEVKNG